MVEVELVQTPIGSARPVDERDIEATLIAAARLGDRAAFSRLYEMYGGVVHGVLLAYVDHADADDLTQEVFLRAMGRLHSLRDSGKLGRWLVAMARNKARDLLRMRKRAAAHARRAARSTVGGGGVGLEASEVMDVIRALPAAYGETLVLRLVEGMTGPQIALRMGRTHGSVRVNLSKGMKMLREKLDTEDKL